MWSLYDNGKFLEPLVFTNGKSQEDIVKEVIEASKQGYKVIFIRGICGTGKSAIALNLAKYFGKTSIVVPIKSLQEQYIRDYTNNKYILKENQKLKISSILGRKNFPCKYLKENQKNDLYKKEINKKLNDIFYGANINTSKDNTADNSLIPCKIEIKEKNGDIIKEYIRNNPLVKNIKFNSVNQVRRMSIAPACPYYSPIIPEEFQIKIFEDSKKYSYLGLKNKKFVIHERKPGCSFYEQYKAYIDSDVIIFNSSKYLLETLMNRKPYTELEVIDECDEFLDSFANQEKININKLLFGLGKIFSDDNKILILINHLTDLTNSIKRKYENINNEIIKLEDTIVEELLLTIIDNQELFDYIDLEESNYIFHLDEVSRKFSDLLKETYFIVEKEDKDIIINLVTTNLKKRFGEIVNNNKLIVMMSGTIHTDYVLKNIYGIENFKIINAETETQGIINKVITGLEIDCKYENFRSGKIEREEYLKIFSKIVELAKPPTLIHLTSFQDLPSEQEKNNYKLILPTQQEIIQDQRLDPLGNKIQNFKDGKNSILYTTRCNRGIDFPGEMCNSIIISRFPYPNISSLFWKMLRRTNRENFMNFYIDKAKRELTQKIYRGLRSKYDKLDLLSPDVRVLNFNL